MNNPSFFASSTSRQLTALCLAFLLLLTGCRYESVLSEKQGLPLDPALFGIWLETQTEEQATKRPPNRVVVIGFNESEYFIQFNNAYFRAYPIRLSGVRCLQVEFLGSSDKGPLAQQHHKRFDVWAMESNGSDILIKSLNRAFVSSELKGSEQLRKAFHQHRDNPELFTNPIYLKKAPVLQKESDESGSQEK